MPYLVVLIVLFVGIIASSTNAMANDNQLIALAKEKLKNVEINDDPNVVRLLRDIDIIIDDTITTTKITDIWYYPTQVAVQDYGYDSIYYNGFAETISNVKALTLDAQGEIFWSDPNDARVIESDTYDVFSNGKELVINYAGLSKGSVTALEYTIETNLTQLETFWSELFYLQSSLSQQEVNIRVKNNSANSIFHEVSDPLISCSKQNTLIVCSAKNIPPLDYGDSYFYQDKAMHVAFSQVNEWQNIAQVMLDSYSVAKSDNSSVLKRLPQIVSPEMNIEEKISAIHQYVARDIRYLSQSEGGNAYTPHSVSRTVDKKFGDCKDKTVLLLEMFEQIGIPAYPVLVSTNRQNTDKLLVPSAAYFNHVVMCFEFRGREHCIDATDTTSDWRYTSEWIQGHASLVLSDAAEVITMQQDPQAWEIENQIDIQITPGGGQTESHTIRFKKAYASTYRGILEGKSNAEKEEYLVDLYQDYVSDGAQPDILVKGIESLADDIEIMTEYEYESYLDMDERISVISYEPWIDFELNSYSFENKTFETNYSGSKVSSVVNISLPKNWEIESYPASLKLVATYGTLIRKVQSTPGGGFTATTTLELPAGAVEASRISNFQKMIEIFSEQALLRFTASYSE